MDGTVIAEGLAFPEGPVWAGDRLWVTEVAGGWLTTWQAAAGTTRVAFTDGGPNGATRAADGRLWVTQNGGMEPATRIPGGLQRVAADGTVETVTGALDDGPLVAPNDLCFGADGCLYFTDPGPMPTEGPVQPGHLCVYEPTSGRGRHLLEVGAVYPNGIAFDAHGVLHWTESMSRRVMRTPSLDAPRAEVVVELPADHNPDGCCFDADGRLYVASTVARCVTVLEHGRIVERLACGDGIVTNCCFGGTDLYVTATHEDGGRLWRFPVGARGLALHDGAR